MNKKLSEKIIDNDVNVIIQKLLHILVIDDDLEILSLLAKFLKINGYIASIAHSTKEADLLLKEFAFDLIIIDVMMAEEDGLTFLKRKREILDIPIMMLTALGGVDDKVSGLQTGADDYLTKPFDPRELLLRMQKLLRHKSVYYEQNLQTKNTKNERILFGDFAFSTQSENLERLGQPVYITNTESRLLAILAKNSGKIVNRDDIIKILNETKSHTKGYNKDNNSINARTIDTQIARLRNKIEKNPKHPEFLQTIRGCGYVLWATIT